LITGAEYFIFWTFCIWEYIFNHFYNNIFYREYVLAGDPTVAFNHIGFNENGSIYLHNNSFYRPTGLIRIYWNGTGYLSGSNPEYFGDDPIFTDPSFASVVTEDFHLNSTSPCINVGNSTYVPSIDFEGNARPRGGYYDIGAFESEWYTVIINNDDYTYFTWLGENTTLSVIGALITGFDQGSEWIAVWNRTTWSSTDGLWVKYQGNDVGTNGNVETFDVICLFMNDTATTQIIPVSPNEDMSYTIARNRTIMKTNQNKGYNYTGYYLTDVTTLSAVVGKTNLTTGEALAHWNNTGQVWEVWIVGFSTTNYNINKYDVILSTVSGKRYLQIG